MRISFLAESEFFTCNSSIKQCTENVKCFNKIHPLVKTAEIFFLDIISKVNLLSLCGYGENIAENMQLHGNTWFNINRPLWH